MAWKIRFHFADVAPSVATPYTDILVSSLTSLTGYGFEDYDVTSVEETPTMAGTKEQADGAIVQTFIARNQYTIKTMPIAYDDRTKLVTMPAILVKKKHKWLELNTASQDALFNVGTTTPYHASDSAIPIEFSDYSVATNFDTGNKIGTFTIARKWRV